MIPLKRILSPLVLLGLALPLLAMTAGCGGGGSDIAITPAPPVTPGTPKPISEDFKKGGGKSSSGNMTRNPGASS